MKRLLILVAAVGILALPSGAMAGSTSSFAPTYTTGTCNFYHQVWYGKIDAGAAYDISQPVCAGGNLAAAFVSKGQESFEVVSPSGIVEPITVCKSGGQFVYQTHLSDIENGTWHLLISASKPTTASLEAISGPNAELTVNCG